MGTVQDNEGSRAVIRTPDQKLRVFVSSTLREMGPEREAVSAAISNLHLSPVLFELGARPHPPQELYRAYLAQSHIFIGLYWERYGWVSPDMDVSGLEDEYRLAGNMPKLIYIKSPAPDREPELKALLADIKEDGSVSYKYFSDAEELRELVENDLALMLAERFEQAGLAQERRPVATPSSAKPPSNLPQLPAPLIGRRVEKEQISSLLRRPDVRLVTLTGPGGVGKTSLALDLVSSLIHEDELFPDGIYWVPLATIREPELVTSAIVGTLEIRERAGHTLLESLGAYLQDKQLLLLLDNFEHVIRAAPVVAELLAGSAGITILVTSRAPLRVRGEHEVPVWPLAIPEQQGAESDEKLRENAAIRLFTERAQAANPQFALTSESIADVTKIVCRLDGLPLAIELAAARVRMLPVAAILQRLDSRLEFLSGGARDLPARQQTMRQAIDWSYDLLDEAAQRLFCRLAVFEDGFTLDAAGAVCGEEGDPDVFEGVGILLDSSLLRRDWGVRPEPRFGMLQTIREYGWERLAEAGEKETVGRRHARYFAAVAEKAGSMMFSGESERWLDVVQTDYSNFRAALNRLQADADGAQISWQMLINLNWFWYRRGYLNEARQWYEQAVEQSARLGDHPLRANILSYAGDIAMWQSDLAASRQLMDEGVSMLRKREPDLNLMIALFTRGVLAINQGEAQLARSLLAETLSLLDEIEQEWFRAMTLLHLGNAALMMDDVEAATARMNEAFAVGEKVGAPWILASVINDFGEIARYQGDYVEAEKHYLESKEIFQSVGSSPDVARADHCLAYVALSRERYAEASSLFDGALAKHERLGIKRGVVECMAGLAAVAAARGALAAAVRLLAAARAQYEELTVGIWPTDALELERVMAHARHELGEEKYAEVASAGRSLGIGEATAQARNLLADLLA